MKALYFSVTLQSKMSASLRPNARISSYTRLYCKCMYYVTKQAISASIVLYLDERLETINICEVCNAIYNTVRGLHRQPTHTHTYTHTYSHKASNVIRNVRSKEEVVVGAAPAAGISDPVPDPPRHPEECSSAVSRCPKQQQARWPLPQCT